MVITAIHQRESNLLELDLKRWEEVTLEEAAASTWVLFPDARIVVILMGADAPQYAIQCGGSDHWANACPQGKPERGNAGGAASRGGGGAGGGGECFNVSLKSRLMYRTRLVRLTYSFGASFSVRLR